MSDFVDAVCKEAKIRNLFVNNLLIETVYFGGGTPSMLSISYLERILQALSENYTISNTCEVTIEVNPDDVTLEKAQQWHKLGVNRISMGIQSFNDEYLQFAGRRHNAQKAIESFTILRQAGFQNISTDIIFGWPNSDEKSLRSDLKFFFRLKAEHFSAYQLTVEKGTRLFRKIKIGEASTLSDDTLVDMYAILIEECEKNGYKQYEISNFARDEKYSKHNTNYWFGVPYIGLGPSAHSFDGHRRSWNVSNLKQYIEGFQNNAEVSEYEEIDEISKYNEFIMTRLRTKWGIDLQTMSQQFEPKLISYFNENCKKLIDKKLLIEKEGTVVLSLAGKHIADSVISDLFYLA
jgi:oxygen-independent coproporphyrinogen-3 oxidase